MSANNPVCIKKLKAGYAVWHELNPDKPKMPKKAKKIINEDNAVWYAMGLCDGIFVNTKYGDCSKYKIKLLFHAIKNGSIYGNQELARCGQCLRDGRPKQNWFECMNGVEFKQ